MGTISSKKIYQLSELFEAKSNYLMIIRNVETGKDMKVKLGTLLTGKIIPTWDPEEEYNTGDNVDWNLKIWKSLTDNNIGNIPSEGANWTEVSANEVLNPLPFNLSRIVPKTGHGFEKGDVITIGPGGQYVKVSDPSSQKFVGIVNEVIDLNQFRLCMYGYIDTLTGLTPGSLYYAQTNGTIGTEETGMLVLMAETATTAHILISGGGIPQPDLDNEPSNHVTNFVATPTSSTSIMLNWTSSIGDVLPDGYLILARSSTGEFAEVVDGTTIGDDTDLSDGSGQKKIAYQPASMSYEFTGLVTDTQYFFKIIPYRGSGSRINYKDAGAPTADATLGALDDLILATNPEFWVRGDSITTDRAGNYSPSAVNSPTISAAVVGGKDAIDLNNSDEDGIHIGAVSGFTEFTAVAFFKCDDTSLNGLLFDCYSSASSFANNGFGLRTMSNQLQVVIRKNAANKTYQFAFTDTTSWHLIVVKVYEEAGSYRIVVKLDGQRIIDESTTGMDSPVNQMRLGTDQNNANNLSFDGLVGEWLFWKRGISRGTEALIHNYINDYYGQSFTLDNTDIVFSGLHFVESLGVRTNGLDVIQNNDGKYDLVFGAINGKIWHAEQGATADDWTITEIIDTGEEISSLKLADIDGDGMLEIITAHKLSAGKLRVHKAQTSSYTGAWSSAVIKTGINWPQAMLFQRVDDQYRLDNNGAKLVLFYTHEGNSSGQGGIHFIEFTGSDVLEGSDWTDRVAYQHEDAWGLAGFFALGSGVARDLLYSARNLRNADAVPGIYYLTPNASGDIRDTWSRTTIEDEVADWLHLDCGNFLGSGGNDVVAITNDDSTIYFFERADSWNRTTVAGSSQGAFNIRRIKQQEENGRDSLFFVVEGESAYYVYWTGSGWFKRTLFSLSSHPFDNEIITLNIDGEGPFEVLFDDSTNPTGKVSWFRVTPL